MTTSSFELKIVRDEEEFSRVLKNEHRVEAEEVTAVSVKYDVSVVPLFLFFQDGIIVDKLEGADTKSLLNKVKELFKAKVPEQLETTLRPQSQLEALNKETIARVKQIIEKEPIMLFMKGSPEMPQCGFSSRAVEALKCVGAKFGHFNILSDEAVRRVAKVYSDWPTYPQLYMGGDFIGGCDIMEDMLASGKLKDSVQALARGNPSSYSTQRRLEKLTKSAGVTVFMKGSPESPRCGFSSKVITALQGQGVKFKFFDILQDSELREDLKKFSQWPTYPQVYADGTFIGGCDIILELLAAGTLRNEIESHSKNAKSLTSNSPNISITNE